MIITDAFGQQWWIRTANMVRIRQDTDEKIPAVLDELLVRDIPCVSKLSPGDSAFVRHQLEYSQDVD